MSWVSPPGSARTRTGGHCPGQKPTNGPPRWAWSTGPSWALQTLGLGAAATGPSLAPLFQVPDEMTLSNSGFIPGVAITSNVCHTLLQAGHQQSSSKP